MHLPGVAPEPPTETERRRMRPNNFPSVAARPTYLPHLPQHCSPSEPRTARRGVPRTRPYVRFRVACPGVNESQPHAGADPKPLC